VCRSSAAIVCTVDRFSRRELGKAETVERVVTAEVGASSVTVLQRAQVSFVEPGERSRRLPQEGQKVRVEVAGMVGKREWRERM